MVACVAALALVDLYQDARLVVRVGAKGLRGQEGCQFGQESSPCNESLHCCRTGNAHLL